MIMQGNNSTGVLVCQEGFVPFLLDMNWAWRKGEEKSCLAPSYNPKYCGKRNFFY